jgi:hypothetical protein
MIYQEWHIEKSTIVGLVIALTIMPAAQILTTAALPKSTRLKYKVLFFWHAYDFLTHFLLEACFLYHSFFSYTEDAALVGKPRATGYVRTLDDVAYLWDDTRRRYGAQFSQHWTALAWQEYGKADERWLVADLNVVSLELLTVFLGGPAAVYVCYQIRKFMTASGQSQRASALTKVWFAATILATAELYGGFMTFCPSWLSGSVELNTRDPVYLWFYLVYFNTLWVWFPLWILYCAWGEFSNAMHSAAVSSKKSI